MKAPAIHLGLLVGALALAAVVSLAVGPVTIPLGRLLSFTGLTGSEALSRTETTILWELRLPRVLLACLVGGGLGAAGAGYQGLFRNPLADPFVIGASSGAALGATLAIVAGIQANVFGLGAISVAALAGALVSVGLVYVIASAGRHAPTVSLLLAGVTLGSFFGGVVSLLMFLNDEKLAVIFGWLMGSFSGRSWPALEATAAPIACAVLALWLLSRSLDALAFGEETAQSLGMHLVRVRGAVVVAASLATAAGVAAAGVIGFVGLIAPHAARFLFGARHSVLIPASALTGAFLMVVADDLARTVVAPVELPIGVLTALLGSPFFLLLLKRRPHQQGGGA